MGVPLARLNTTATPAVTVLQGLTRWTVGVIDLYIYLACVGEW